MDSSAIYRHIGATLRARRKKLKMTQETLSSRVGLSRASLASNEIGRQKVLVHHLFELAAALKLEPNDLLPQLPAKSGGRASEALPLPGDLNPKQRQQVSKLFLADVSNATPMTEEPNAATQTKRIEARTRSRRAS